jgi:hypothetical protein
MKKGLYIKRVIGKKLFPLGFAYTVPAGLWMFERIVHVNDEDVPQQIMIKRSNHSSSLYFRIRVYAYGQEIDYSLSDCIPGTKDYKFDFSTDDDFKKLINNFAEVLLEYVIPFMASKSVPTIHVSQRPSKDDIEYVGRYHEKLAQEFMVENGVDLQISVEDFYRIIFLSLEKIREETYLGAKESIFKIAMFFAEWAHIHRQGEWVIEKGRTDLWYSIIPEAKKTGIFNPLEIIFRAFMACKEDSEEKMMIFLGFLNT